MAILFTNVAPLVGAWVETLGRSTRRRASVVAPLVGAWVETNGLARLKGEEAVAPLVGAWVETDSLTVVTDGVSGRAPRGRVG